MAEDDEDFDDTLPPKRLSANMMKFLKRYEKNDFNIAVTCKEAGVSRNAFYKWKKQNHTFKDKVTDALDEVLDAAEDCMYKSVKKGNITAAMYILNNLGKGRGYNILPGDKRPEEVKKGTGVLKTPLRTPMLEDFSALAIEQQKRSKANALEKSSAS